MSIRLELFSLLFGLKVKNVDVVGEFEKSPTLESLCHVLYDATVKGCGRTCRIELTRYITPAFIAT
jgi:hypothetical protein